MHMSEGMFSHVVAHMSLWQDKKNVSTFQFIKLPYLELRIEIMDIFRF